MKKFLALFLSLFLLFSCNLEKNKIEQNETKNTEKIAITSSIVPVSSILNYIGGENIEVKNIVPAGVSPHSFDLKTSDLVNLEKTQGVVIVGLEHIDGFLNKAISEKNILKLASDIELLDAGEHHHHEDEHSEEHDEDKHHYENSESDEREIEHDKNLEDEHSEEHHENEDLENHEHEENSNKKEHDDKHEHEENHEEENEHNHEKDPHIWNGAKNAKIISEKISKFLTEINPEKKDIFEKNAKEFSEKIDEIERNFLEKIKGKEQKHFIVFHDAYNYLFRDLDIDTGKKLVFRTSVLNDPNSNDMKNLIDEIKKHDIKVAFVEPQFKNGNLEKLAKKYGINIFILDPLGQDEGKDGYLQNLENNLKNLENIYKN